jgi:hypothetical protein
MMLYQHTPQVLIQQSELYVSRHHIHIKQWTGDGYVFGGKINNQVSASSS